MSGYRPQTRAPEATEALAARFWAKVDKSAGSGGCWPWTASVDGGGYGMFKVDGRMWRAPRVAWLLETGDDPGGANVLHRCDVPTCVNHAHLFLGDQQTNMRDCREKGRLGQQLPGYRPYNVGPARLCEYVISQHASNKPTPASPG